jgi:N-acetyl-anhydromuramyl-L-alanine amidase AmpD
VLGIQTPYEKENNIQPENSLTSPESTTISSLIDNLGKIGYAVPPGAYKTHIRSVVAGPTVIINIDNPNNVAVKSYKEKYKKEIESAGIKYGYTLK